MLRQVVLVDKHDNQTGLMGVEEAHKSPGTLHRAISVLLVKEGSGGLETLIHKRSDKKPLWPGYWSDSCSTHPYEGESYEESASRRLKDEMGIVIPPSSFTLLDKLYYRAQYNEKLAEHELDAILIAQYDGGYTLNEDEVSEAKWVLVSELYKDLEKDDSLYAPWFTLLLDLESVRGEVNEQ